MSCDVKRLSSLSSSAAAIAIAMLLLSSCGRESPDQLVASARGYLEKGDHAAAIIQLKNALQAAPDSGDARFLLGRASLRTRDFASAEKELRRALELKQPEEMVLPELAKAMMEQGKHEALISEFGDRHLKDAKAEAAFQTLLGDSYLQRGERAVAAKAYEVALAAKPDYPPARLGQIAIVAFDGRADEAEKRLDALIAEEPRLAQAHFIKGNLLLSKGKRKEARKELEAAIASDDGFVPARLGLIELLIDERDFEAAEKLTASTRAIAPRDLRVTYLEASLALRRDNVDKAEQLLQQVLKYLPDHVPSLVLAGAVEVRKKNYNGARNNLSKALARAPGHVGARMLLVDTLLKLGQPVEAKETLLPLVQGGVPNDARLQLLAGETFLANGDVERASTFFQAAASSSPKLEVAAKTRLGQIALASGNTEQGFKELEAASDLDAGGYQADLALIAGHLRRKEISKAMEATKALEKKQPKNPLTFHMYGMVNLAKGDTAAARTSFEKALELRPDYLPSAFNLAQMDLLAKKPEAALKRIEGMIAKYPNNEQLYIALANLQSRTGAPAKDVHATLRRGVSANPQSATVRVALIGALVGAGESDAALAAAREAIAAFPSEPRVLDVSGMAQEVAGEVNQAAETFTKLAAIQPNSVTPLYRIAGLRIRQKDYDKAIEALERAKKLQPKSREIAPQLVHVYLAANRQDDALKVVRELKKEEPKFAGGYALEGDVFFSQKKFTEAEGAYRQALKIEPTAGAVAVKLFSVLSAAGKSAEADAVAKKWIAENPKDVAMRLYLADRDLQKNNLKSAQAHYEAVIAVDPKNVLALNNLAWVGGKTNDPRALDFGERAVRLAPRNGAVLDTFGMLLLEKGRPEQALVFLERALKLEPTRNDFRLNYAKALLKIGKKDEARRELQSLQAVKESFKGKEEVPGLLKNL